MKYKLLNDSKYKQFNIVNQMSINDELKYGKWPKRYRFEYIEPGVCSYEDFGAGVVYIGQEAIDKIAPTYIGKPVVNEVHKDLTPEQAYKLSDEDLESMADGIIYEIGKADNGWSYMDIIIWDEETQRNIEQKNYSGSCAYIVDKDGPEGKYNEVKYDQEVLSGFGTHVAIVSNPRYKDAKVYLLNETSLLEEGYFNELAKEIRNSKGDKMKIFKKVHYLLNSGTKNQEPEEKKKEEKKEEMMNAKGSMIEMENGKKIPLEDAINAYKEKMKSQKSNTINMDDDVEVDGKMVKAKTLVDSYNLCNPKKEEKKNEAPDAQDDGIMEDVVDEKKSLQNSKQKDPPPVPKQPEKKEDHFKVLRNAATQTQEHKIILNTRDERIARGKERYGSKEAS